jgi:hypothetical protein
MLEVTATQRLIEVDSDSKEFDVYLKYCVYPMGADFYQGDTVGFYEGAVIGDCVSIKLKDGRLAYTKGENVV